MIVSTTKQSNKESKLMKNDTLKLTDRKVLEMTRERLKVHFPLEAQGYKCTSDDLYNALLGVSANRGSLEAVCTDLMKLPCAETLRRYLQQQLRPADLPNLEQRLNTALVEQLPRLLWKKPQEVAIDFHDEPYYGKQSQQQGLWVRGRLQHGTTHFYRLATAYVIHNQVRSTLAIHFVRPGDTTLTVLKHLLRRVRALQLSLGALYLDKAFAGVTEMRFLTKLGVPSIIACSVRGKQGGTRALCHGRQSYLSHNTFRRREGVHFTAKLAVCRVYTTAKRTGRMKRQAKWVLFIVIHLPHWNPERIRHHYRSRFGIESSYRCARTVMGWTTSSNPAYRFTLLALAFVLVNVWIHLRWLFTQVARRGRRKLDVKRLQLSRLAKFVSRALEQIYGCSHQIVADVIPITQF